MKLLTEELRAQLPALYSTEGTSAMDKHVYAKFFFPMGNWTWFVLEGSAQEDDFLFFGYVVGLEEELGYFSLSELEGIDIHGLTVERDLYFTPGTLREVLEQFRRERA
ncbi:MAG: DUF2958 domain-containing protein [Aridibacter famidurans]|nr:DUF2958 domain-containing protein [Aridibacter famidurans]